MIPLPKPWESEYSYSRRLARGSIPRGAAQHYDRIRCPHPKPMRRECEAIINVVTGCAGDPSQVIELAQKMVQQLMAEGKKEDAVRILAAVRKFMEEVE